MIDYSRNNVFEIQWIIQRFQRNAIHSVFGFRLGFSCLVNDCCFGHSIPVFPNWNLGNFQSQHGSLELLVCWLVYLNGYFDIIYTYSVHKFSLIGNYMYGSRWHFRTGFLLRARRVLAAIQHCLFSNFTVQSKCNALLERKTGNDNAHQSKRIKRFARAARVSKTKL